MDDPGYLEAMASLHMLKTSGMSDYESILLHSRKMILTNDTYIHTLEYYHKILNHDVRPLLSELKTISTFNENRITLDQIVPDEHDLADSPSMEYKMTDKAIYYMLRDSVGVGIHLVGENVFRRYEIRPEPDELVVDKAVAIHLMLRLE